MKRFVFSLVTCLSLLVTTAWLVVNPAYAASITVSCSNGTTLTCEGSSCSGQDSSVGGSGWCSCSSTTGSDTKNCGGGEDILLD